MQHVSYVLYFPSNMTRVYIFDLIDVSLSKFGSLLIIRASQMGDAFLNFTIFGVIAGRTEARECVLLLLERHYKSGLKLQSFIIFLFLWSSNYYSSSLYFLNLCCVLYLNFLIWIVLSCRIFFKKYLYYLSILLCNICVIINLFILIENNCQIKLFKFKNIEWVKNEWEVIE